MCRLLTKMLSTERTYKWWRGLMWRVTLLRFHQSSKSMSGSAYCRCAILPAIAPQRAQKTWSCWCNANGTSSYWTVACTDTSCQTVTSSSQHGNVNKHTCHTALCSGRTIQVAFSWRPIQGSKMIASREDFQRPGTSMMRCASQK